MFDGDDRDAKGRAGFWLAATVVAVVVALAYLPSLGNGFTFDDQFAVQDSTYLLSQPSLFARLFSADYFALSGEATWRPVVTATYMVDWQVGRGAPFAFHLQSLIWHLIACVLAVALFTRLLGDVRTAAVAALLFGVHPLATEAVDAIAFREDVLCTALGLGAVLLTVRGRGRGIEATLVAGGLLLLALLAKESAIVFVVLAPLTWWGADVVDDPSSTLRGAVGARRRSVPALAVAVALFAVLRFGVFPGMDDYAEHAGGSLATGVASGLAAALRYVWLLFVPAPLCPDYRGVVPPVSDLSDVRAWGGAALLVALAVVAWRLRARLPSVSVGLTWFVVSLAPTIGLVAIPVFMAERFVYTALPGAALAAVGGAAAAARHAGVRNVRLVGVVVAVAALALGTLTWRRHAAWRDDLTLWGTLLEDYPGTYGALHGLGTAEQAEGRFEASLPYLVEALRVADTTPGVADPERAGLLAAIGTAHGAAGRVPESMDALTRSLALQEDAQARYHLGLGFLQLGRPADAEREMRTAIDFDPLYAPPYEALSELLRARGETDEADRLLTRHRELSAPR